MKTKNKKNKYKEIIVNYFYENVKGIITVSIILAIGIIIGTILVNNVQEERKK